MFVKDILRVKGTSVVTIEPTATLKTAMIKLCRYGIGALVITGPGGRISGIISERDIVRAIGQEGETALDNPVGLVMTRRVVTATQHDTVHDVMESMSNGKFRHVPIVDGNELIGIISIGDVVKSRLEEMEMESSALKTYILTA